MKNYSLWHVLTNKDQVKKELIAYRDSQPDSTNKILTNVMIGFLGLGLIIVVIFLIWLALIIWIIFAIKNNWNGPTYSMQPWLKGVSITGAIISGVGFFLYLGIYDFIAIVLTLVIIYAGRTRITRITK